MIGIRIGALVTVTDIEGRTRTDRVSSIDDHGLLLTTRHGHDPGSWPWERITDLQVWQNDSSTFMES